MSRSPTSAKPSGTADRAAPGRRWWCVALVAVAYLGVFPFFPTLRNPNEAVRVWTTRALVLHGTFVIDRVEAAWGEVSDRARVGDHHVSSKAPGVSLLGVPVLAAATGIARVTGAGPLGEATTTWLLRVFAVAAPMLAFLALFAREVERVTRAAWARDLLVAGLGLGTLLYPNGLLFVGHALSAAAAMTSLLLLRRRADAERGQLALAGAFAGVAVLCEYQTLLVAGLLFAWAAYVHRTRVLWFVAGALPCALALGAYHAALFGSPFAFPYAHLDDPVYQVAHSSGFFGLSRPKPVVLAVALFRPDYGLFFYSPFLLVGLVAAAVALVRARRWTRAEPRAGAEAPSASEAAAEHALVLAVLATMLLFLAGMTNWRAGWVAAGPRYIAVVAPFLAWSIALAWPVLTNTPWKRALLVGLVMASVASCVLAGAIFPHFPLAFANPLRAVALRLLAEGYAPRGLGRALGLPAALALAPVVLACGGALALAIRGSERPGRLAAGALLVAALALLPAALVGPKHTFAAREEDRAFEIVRGFVHGLP